MNLIILLFAAVFVSSCEDVIDIPLDTDHPKLVIEASIDWQKGTSGKNQKIKLSTTTNYYSTTIPKISGATVFIKNSSNEVFHFMESPTTGTYSCTDFVPVLNQTYTLTVLHNGQTYTATETMKPVAPIDSVTQETQTGLETNTLAVKSFYTDPAHVENFYLYSYKFLKNATPVYYASEDLLFQGNTFFSIAFQEDALPGDQVEIAHFGISKAYFNYMNVLVAVAENSDQGPFQTVPAAVKGNIKNTKAAQDNPLGYFRLSEVDKITYTIQ